MITHCLSLCIVQIMMGDALQRRLAGKGVVVSALHPGMVSAYIHIDYSQIQPKQCTSFHLVSSTVLLVMYAS